MAEQGDEASFEALVREEAAYADLVAIYPENCAYLKKYADILFAVGKTATAIEALKTLYRLLEKQSPRDATKLAKEYPQIGRIIKTEEELEDVQELGRRLTGFFGFLWIKLNQRRLKEGQRLYRLGEEGDSLALLLRGELAVFVTDSQGKSLLLDLIGEMDVAGEGGFLNPGPRTADVVANRDSTIVELPRKKLLTFFMDNPDILRVLEQKANFRRMVGLISQSMLFSGLPLSMRQHLAEHAIVTEYAASSLIHRAGSTADTIDMVLRGKAYYAIRTSAGQRLRMGDLPIGEMIGDTSALREATCPADIVAETNVALAQFPFSTFKTVAEAYPPMKERLLKHAEKQRLDLMQMVSALKKKT